MIIKAYAIYFYSGNNSCITHLSVDGTSKKKALKLGNDMARLLEEYYTSLPWPLKVTVRVEEYKKTRNG